MERDNKKHYIYKLTSPNGTIYIGRTNNFKQRMLSHESSAKRGEKRPLYDSIRKHGWEWFTKEIIATVVGRELAAIAELHYINLFDSINKGYNLSAETEGGGDNWEGRRDTPEFKAFVAHMSSLKVGEKNNMHGKHHSPEAIAKQKAAAVGRFSLPWFIAKFGDEQGKIKYRERGQALRERNLKKNEIGRFVKSSNKV